MAPEMIGQAIEHRLDLAVIGDAARRPRADYGEEGMAEFVRGEEPVEVAARHAAVRRDSAFLPSTFELDERPPTVRPVGAADMHLVAPKRSTARQMLAANFRQA